jgi:hypothetical protein
MAKVPFTNPDNVVVVHFNSGDPITATYKDISLFAIRDCLVIQTNNVQTIYPLSSIARIDVFEKED